MNADTLLQLLHKSFRVTLGATSSLVENLQDPIKRNESFSKVSTELSQLAEEWAAKGEVTEQEARNFVETVMAQRASQHYPENSAGSSSSTTATPPTTDPTVQVELEELTAQVAAMRAELERLRSQDSGV